MARTSQRGEGAESTRDRLIEATRDHLARLGPRSVELRAICVELGISPSLVNYHFQSTGELLWLAAISGYAEHVDRQRDAVSRAPDGRAAVERWLRGTIAFKRDETGIAAVIDYPQLAFVGDDMIDPADYSKQLGELSRANVAILGSAVLAAMTGRPVRMLSSQRVALLIKTNKDFAFWISTVGFGGQGSATWIAGRKPYGAMWRLFGFSPDRQITTTINELVTRLGTVRLTDLPSDTEPDS
jgi:AcrR family transcriptional regulator